MLRGRGAKEACGVGALRDAEVSVVPKGPHGVARSRATADLRKVEGHLLLRWGGIPQQGDDPRSPRALDLADKSRPLGGDAEVEDFCFLMGRWLEDFKIAEVGIELLQKPVVCRERGTAGEADHAQPSARHGPSSD